MLFENIDAGMEADRVSIEQMLDVIEKNRTRVRNLAGLIVSVSGMLLSATLVALSFALKDVRSHVPPFLLLGFLSVPVCLAGACVLAVLAALVPPPSALSRRTQMVDVLASRMHAEYRRVRTATFLLLTGIVLFTTLLLLFAFAISF